MELRQLRHFVAVVTYGNFSKAAKELHLTQPALSRQVKNLEEELGVILLDRKTNTTSLTTTGRLFYEDAREVLARIDQVTRRIKRQAKEEPVRVGFLPAVTADLLPLVLSRFQKAYEYAAPEFFDLMPQEILQRMRDKEIDVVILPKGLETEAPSFQWTDLLTLAPVLVMPKKHSLAKLKKVSPKSLADRPLYGFSRTNYPSYIARLQSVLRPFGVTPIVENYTANGLTTLFASLEANNGLAVLSEGVIGLLPANLVVRPFSPSLPRLQVVVGLSADAPKQQAEVFVKLLLETAARGKFRFQ